MGPDQFAGIDAPLEKALNRGGVPVCACLREAVLPLRGRGRVLQAALRVEKRLDGIKPRSNLGPQCTPNIHSQAEYGTAATECRTLSESFP